MKEIALPLVTARPATAVGEEAVRFQRLWDDCYAAVHAHAARRVGSARAEEVCSEVFLIAWRRIDAIPGDALPWLLATSRNVIGTFWRGDARRDRLRDRLEELPPEHAADELDAPDPELRAALAQLDEPDRELLLLVYWDDLTPSRAAKALGLAPATARTRLWRLRRRLADVLAHEEDAR
ncbi:MAG TPA: sigma-70 family RNA polymerase sigma factor [Gaiellales bacterium]